jgi:hypothetical protein
MTKKKIQEVSIEQNITRIFEESHISFQKNVIVNNFSSDYFVETSSGGTAIFEVKNWEPTPENIENAKHLSQNYRKYAGTDVAYIIMPSGDSFPEEGVIAINDLENEIQKGALSSIKSKQQKPNVKPSPNESAFVAMPFSKKYNDTFAYPISGACFEVNLKPIRIDHQSFVGDIVNEIKKGIFKCSVLISDVSESRPNVLYEIGIAEGLKKPTIQICSTPIEKMPFDIRNNNTIYYEKGDTASLQPKIKSQLAKLGFRVRRDLRSK